MTAVIYRLTGFLLPSDARRPVPFAWEDPGARDLTNDWKRWSRAERFGAVVILVLLLLVEARVAVSFCL